MCRQSKKSKMLRSYSAAFEAATVESLDTATDSIASPFPIIHIEASNGTNQIDLADIDCLEQFV